MTHVIKAKNVNDALVEGLWWLKISGLVDQSRNGRVIVSPEPVVTEYQHPRERVLFAPVRDANPFFHLMEALWMLAGRNDVRFPAHFAANIASFSDDGVTIAGAYGHRWRKKFGYDQIPMITDELRMNPQSRRCVLSMWDPVGLDNIGNDLCLAMNGGKDVPCNTQVYFDTLGGKLNMTATNRSNDVVWGCYGANMVHFSVLHEYVGHMTGIELGVYRQFSNNFHIYADRPDVQRLLHVDGTPLVPCDDRYAINGLAPFPLVTDVPAWHYDMEYFFSTWDENREYDADSFADPFWGNVVAPIVNAHSAYKKKAIASAFGWLELCQAQDWRLACMQWIDRRKEKRNV